MGFCCVVGCSSRTGSNKKEHHNLSFHQFPKNLSLRRSWEMRISRANLPARPLVCSKHFTPDSYKGGSFKEQFNQSRRGSHRRELLSIAVPTLHLRPCDQVDVPEEDHAKREVRARRRLVNDLLVDADTPHTDGRGQKKTGRQRKHSQGSILDQESAVMSTDTSQAQPTLQVSTSCQTDITLPPWQSLDSLFVFGSHSMPADPMIVAEDHSYGKASIHTETYPSPEIVEPVPTVFAQAPSLPIREATSDVSFSEDELMPDHASDQSYQPSDSEMSEPEPLDDNTELDILGDLKFVAFLSQLRQLLKRCQECGAPMLHYQHVKQGSCVIFTGCCSNLHDFRWVSAPKLGLMPATNLLLSASILFSGSSYTTFRKAFQFLNIALHSEKTHHNIQSSYLFPVVHQAWEKEEEAVLRSSKSASAITVIGDGRCDSPGFSAKYGTYTMMDSATSQIMTFKIVQVTEASSSVGMEKVGFQHCLDKLLEMEIPVKTVATDRHPSISALMGNGPKGEPKYREIDHQYDVWHLSKSIKKRLRAAAKKKGCEKLNMWIQSISNHLWWCASSCQKDSTNLIDRWLSIIHHVANHHNWGGDSTFTKCEHRDFSNDESRKVKWLKAGSLTHSELVKVVTDKRVLQDIRKLNGFCHTGELETYHAMMTKYCPKRKHFQYPGMYARTALAALDHNHSVARAQAKTKSGEARFSTSCSKANQNWVAKPIKVSKTYDHVTDLMLAVMKQKGKRNGNADKLCYHLPQQKKNIAKSHQPLKEEVVARHRSRFR